MTITVPRQILPTHTCFDDVAEWYTLHATKMPLQELANYEFVHGVGIGYEIGEGAAENAPYAHAWILHRADSFVYDFGLHSETKEKLILQIDALEFYQGRRIREQVCYNAAEYLAANKITGFSGPWRYFVARYCRDATKRIFDPDVARLGEYQRLTPGAPF